ncbi:hypothetical protein ACI1US_01861 [Leucobacter sp. BZR 635]
MERQRGTRGDLFGPPRSGFIERRAQSQHSYWETVSWSRRMWAQTLAP